MIRARFEWKLQDLWVGLFWKRGRDEWFESGDAFFTCERLDVWICVLPCVPLHIVWCGDAKPTDFMEHSAGKHIGELMDERMETQS